MEVEAMESPVLMSERLRLSTLEMVKFGAMATATCCPA
jgi:hypothetical protein